MIEWKTLKEWPRYKISSAGEVLGPRKKLIVFESSGYFYVNLHEKGKQSKVAIHRLVAMAFLENPTDKKCVNHKNGDKSNNNVFNLEWCTYSENMIHAKRVLKQISRSWQGKTGELHCRSKGFDALMPDGTRRRFGSQMEAGRHGLDVTKISIIRNHFVLPYLVPKGKMAGITILN